MRPLLASFLFAFVAIAAFSEVPGGKPASAPEIVLDQASADIFPESWRTPKVNAKAELLGETELGRCRNIVDRALGKYPADLLTTTLKKIYCLGRLEYSGAVTGGTRSRSAIYVVCKPSYASTDVERIIHAEYSSVLFQKFPQHFDAEAWKAVNPADFRYLGGGVQSVKSGQAKLPSDEATQVQGFIKEYAKASIEEDFNCHIAPLMMGDAAYWNAVTKHPKLKAKSDLVIGFYSKIHASFTRAKFQSLRDEAAKANVGVSNLNLQHICRFTSSSRFSLHPQSHCAARRVVACVW